MKQNIIIDKKSINKKVNDTWNKLAFIMQTAIPLCDELMETTEPKHQLKKAMKDFLRESEKLNGKHYKMFANAENVTCPNDKEHHSLDIWQITAKAYDDILNRPPHEVASINHIVKELEAKGVKLTDINIPYEKVKQ